MTTLTALRTARPLTGLRARDLVGPVAAGSATLLASLTLTVVSAWLITRAWEMPPVMDLTVAVTAVRALGISRAAFRYTDRMASHRLALRCAGTARTTVYRRLAAAPATRTAALGRGEVVTRLTDDIDAVAEVIVRSVVPALVAATTGTLAVGFTAALSVPAAAVLACGLLVAGTGAPSAVSRSIRTTETRRAAAGERWATAVDRVLTDSATLRVRGTLRPALAEAGDAARELSAAEESGAPARAAGAGLSVFASAATVVGVLVVATVAYLDGGVPVHSPQWFGVLVLLATAAFEATSTLPEAAEAATRAAGAATRLASVTGEDPVPDPRSVPDVASGAARVSDAPRLCATHLSYGRDHVLGNVDLDLPAGARHTVTAASGTGKTTLLLTLAGLLPPREGQVTLDGVPLDRIDPELLHRTVAYLPEDAHVFATTVRDNLAVGAPDAPDALMVSVLDAVGLSGWVTGLPGGLSTVLADGAESLSGGQRRRLLLARMLLTDAPVLLLDEPFEHLDTDGTAELEALLASPQLPGARPARTVVVVRHPR